jgi:hypothetical protein
MPAASAFTLQKPCQSKKLNDFMDVQVLPGSETHDVPRQAARMARQFLPL